MSFKPKNHLVGLCQGFGTSNKIKYFSVLYWFIILLLCVWRSQAGSIHSWDFKSVTSSNFVDNGSGTAANIPQTTNYIANDYGVHLAYEKLSISTADIFQSEFFTIYGWFYSHLASGYYLFWEQDSAIDRFCLSVTPTGYFAISLTNSVGLSQYKISTISANTGWNFFYIKLQLSFGYTTATLGVVNTIKFKSIWYV